MHDSHLIALTKHGWRDQPLGAQAFGVIHRGLYGPDSQPRINTNENELFLPGY